MLSHGQLDFVGITQGLTPFYYQILNIYLIFLSGQEIFNVWSVAPD